MLEMPELANTRVAAPAALDLAYLKPQIKIETLLCHWPAWPHLIAPASHAMNVAIRHLPNLQSFVATPSVHIAAVADPEMIGGPFVCLREEDVPRVRALIRDMSASCARLLGFAQAFRALDAKLQNGARGACMDEHYRSLDAHLSGVVELVYDLNNHPKIKLLEELLYDGALSNRACQQICLHDVRDSAREFFMSTPLLEKPGRVFVDMAFDDPRIDQLAAMRLEPGSVRELAKALSPRETEMSTFLDMFTSEAPRRESPEYAGDDVRIRYFGHACVLLQAAGVSILLDPLTAFERDAGQATLTFADLPDFIDYCVISHPHHDHFVAEMLVQLRGRIGQVIVPHNDRGNLADPSMKLILHSLGYRNVLSVDPFDSIDFAGGQIMSLPFFGEHAGLDINSKHCILVRLKGRSFAFLVDSDGIDAALYRHIGARVGKLDALFIGMECKGAPLTWLYGPLLGKPVSRREDESRRLSGSDCERAWTILEHLPSQQVFVYAMGQEPWVRHMMGLEYEPESVQIVESDKFVARCRSSGIPAERLKGCREMFF